MRAQRCDARAAAQGPRPGPARLVQTDRQLGLATLALAAIALVISIYAVHAALPANAVRLPLEDTQDVNSVLPEGWAFFTANPQTVYPQAYEITSGGSVTALGGSLAVPSDWFGLNRSVRAEGSEIALITQNVPGSAWRACTRQPTRCLSARPATLHLANTSPLQNMCGQVGFVRQQVLPWAWRGTGTVMPSQVLRAEVSCEPAR